MQSDSLHTAILYGLNTEALYWTCILVKQGDIEKLEDTWIAITALFGEQASTAFDKTWRIVNERLLDLLTREEYHIAEVLEMTGMLLLLHRKSGSSSAKKVTTNTALRKEILEHFPEGAMLTYKGQETFRRILPMSTSDTFTFCHRILAGLSRLVTDENWEEVNKAVQYISKKGFTLPLPGEWPAPSLKEAGKGNPCWFLWGALLSVLPCQGLVEIHWKLFSWNWKPASRRSRLGLLWGLTHYLQNNENRERTPTWTKEELVVLTKVRESAEHLWKEVLHGEDQEEEEVQEAPTSYMDILEQYHPRGVFHKPPEEPPLPPSIAEKTIHLKSRKGRLMEEGDLKPKAATIKKVPESYASSDFDPRHRWLDFGTEKSGTTKVVPQNGTK